MDRPLLREADTSFELQNGLSHQMSRAKRTGGQAWGCAFGPEPNRPWAAQPKRGTKAARRNVSASPGLPDGEFDESRCPARVEKSFPCTEDTDRYNGIIAYLTTVCKGNVHDGDAVLVTANDDPCSTARNIANLRDGSCANTGNVPNSWVCYDFKGRSLKPTDYSVSSNLYLRNWVIEGSNDGAAWVQLDRRENYEEPMDFKAAKVFPVAACDQLRMIRFRQIGPNYYGNDVLHFYSLEIFGSVFEEPVPVDQEVGEE
jgi:hypothetical protein